MLRKSNTDLLRPRLLFACLLPALSPSAGAETWLGAGASHFAIDGGHPAIGRVDAAGIYLGLYQRHSSAPLEFALTTGGSSGFDVAAVNTDYDPFYPADTAAYGFIDVALRYYPAIMQHGSAQSYLSLAWGIHSVNWDHYVFDQTGAGLSLGAGVLLPLTENWSLELGVHYTRYSSEQFLFPAGDQPIHENTVWRIGVGLIRRFRLFE